MSTEKGAIWKKISSSNHQFSGKKLLVFRRVDTGASLLEVLETTGGYDVEAFLPSTGEKANGKWWVTYKLDVVLEPDGDGAWNGNSMSQV